MWQWKIHHFWMILRHVRWKRPWKGRISWPCLILEADISAVSWMLEYEHVRRPSFFNGHSHVGMFLAKGLGILVRKWRHFYPKQGVPGTQWQWSCVLPCPICDGNEVGFGNVLCQRNVSCTLDGSMLFCGCSLFDHWNMPPKFPWRYYEDANVTLSA